jgi:hypothetical protein
MIPGLEVIREVLRHGVHVAGQQDTLLALRPDQQGRIIGPQRKVREVPDANGVESVHGFSVMPLDYPPKGMTA